MEGEIHKQIRKNLMKALEKNEFKPRSSHEEYGRIYLYHGEKAPENWLSDADLVLPSNGAIRHLIEIKHRDVTPKVILGVIEATDLATKCAIGKGEPIEVKNVTLFVVLNSQALQGHGKRKSHKPEQVKLLEKLMKERLGKGSLTDLRIFDFGQDEKDFGELIQALKSQKV